MMAIRPRKHTHVVELDNPTDDEIKWLQALDPSMEYHPTHRYANHAIDYTIRAYATLSPTPEQLTLLHIKYGELMTVYTLPTLH